jgi:signal transduction histidine kinase
MTRLRYVAWPLGIAMVILMVYVRVSGRGRGYGLVHPFLLGLELAASLALLLVMSVGSGGSSLPVLAVVGVTWTVPELAGWSLVPAALRNLADAWSHMLPALTVAGLLGVATRPEARSDRARTQGGLTALALAGGVIASTSRLFLVDPFRDPRCWRTCGHNPLALTGTTPIGLALEWLGAGVVSGAVAWLAVLTAGQLRRRVGPPAATAVAATLVAVASVAPGLLRIDFTERPATAAHLTAFVTAQLAAIGTGLLIGRSAWQRWRLRARLTHLASTLRAFPPPGTLICELRRMLRSPDLQVLYWAPARGHYVDGEGAEMDLPTLRDGRRVTLLARGEQSVAAFIHPLGLDGERLNNALGAAMRLAVENEQLRAATLAELRELQLSRARIVDRAGLERRRLERNLHDGAQQRVVSLALLVRMLNSLPGDPEIAAAAERAAELTRSIVDGLRLLARGIHPAVLADSGLAGALYDLAESSTDLPVQVDIADDHRYEPAVETTAYRVVEAALADARSRHASQVRVRESCQGDSLVIDIVDDARPGPWPTVGALQPQVAALAGQVELERRDLGSHVRMVLPCGS